MIYIFYIGRCFNVYERGCTKDIDDVYFKWCDGYFHLEWRNDNNNGMTLNISNPLRFLRNLAFKATTRDYNLTSNIMLQSFSKHGAK